MQRNVFAEKGFTHVMGPSPAIVPAGGDAWDGWNVFFAGAGVIVLVGTVIRHRVPEFRRPGLVWGWIFGFVLLSIGLGNTIVWIWAFVLAAVGVSILKRVLTSGQ